MPHARWRGNFFVSYKGGLLSRPGTAFVGICKQTASATSTPPRNIEFIFNIYQSYILDFGELYMRVVANGGYVTQAPVAITGATQADPCVITAAAHGFSNGDAVFITGVGGMVQIDGIIFIVANATTNTFSLDDEFGDPVDARPYGAYTSGGTVARLFTLATPYHAADLPYLKYKQSADVMSLTCVNIATQIDYEPQELTRLAADNWTIAPPSFASSIGPPASCSVTGTAYSTGPGPAAYGYVVTAIDQNTGEESIASPIGTVTTVVDIAGQFGTNTVTCAAVSGASSYNFYRAAPDYTDTGNFTGQLFGYVGSSGTTSWQDSNIIADFTTTPPLHFDPFPSTGNYPGVVTYFQQRRGYAATLNAPDTYQFSQPGAYLNFDLASPPIDSDAIIGAPWAEQVNGIQWMLPMPGGLVVFTGQQAWQLAGAGGFGGSGIAFTPAQQFAQAQESIGCSPTLPPLRIAYNILYGGALNATVRELNYNFYFAIYAGQDITLLSSHMFQGFQLLEWASAFEPYRLIWAVRSDGKMLSFAYVKEQEVAGWSRHDTNGVAVSVAVASEPPVNAPYWIVKRYIVGKGRWAYMQERMDNRIWPNVEAAWCVDCGLALPQPTPAANLTASAVQGAGTVKFNAIILGGDNYSATPAGVISDDAGTGTGATVTSFTVTAGVITGLTLTPGTGYGQPRLTITDATGSGALISLIADYSVTLTADANVFSAGDIGSVVRVGGGIGVVSSYVSPTQIIAQIAPQAAITATVPDDPNNTPLPAPSGSWTLTVPVGTVGGLGHLEGMTVDALADGTPVKGLVVTDGMVTLSNAASQITIGLPFLPQTQLMHADLPGQLIQGKRKRMQGVTVRFANSRGVKIGQDQPIAAVARNQVETPWDQGPNFMTALTEPAAQAGAGNALPLFSGDKYVVLGGDYQTTDGQPSPGMVAVQQDYPLPCEILAFIGGIELGDVPDG